MAASATPVARVGGTGPDRDALTLAFADSVIPQLKGVAKAIYSTGRFVAVTDKGAVFALENAPARDRAEKYRPAVEQALGAHFGAPVTLVLVDDAQAARYGSGAAGSSSPSAPAPDAGRAPVPAADAATGPGQGPGADTGSDPEEDPSAIDVSELRDATDVATSGIDKLTQAFPGSVLVEDDGASA